ncbi:unnamed protein product [Cunninghamella blakesleeana]
MKKSKGKFKNLLLRVDHADILKEIARMGSCNPVNSCHHCRDWTQLIYKKQLLGKQQSIKQVKENTNYVTAGKYNIAINSKDTFNRELRQETDIPTAFNVKKEAAAVLESLLNNELKSTTSTTNPNHNSELLKKCISACEDWMITANQFSFLPPMFRQVDFEEEIADEHFDLITNDNDSFQQQLKILKVVVCDRQGVSLTIDQMALLKGMRKSHLKRVESDPTCCCDIKHDSPSNLQTEIDIINEKMKLALKEYLIVLNDKLTTCWKPLNDFNIKILSMEKKLNDIVNDGLTEKMDTLIKKNNIVPFQDFWTPLVPGFKKKKSGVDVKAVDETFLGYLDQLTLAIANFYSQFVTSVLEELVQFNKEFSVFVLSAIENLMERVTNNTLIVAQLQEKGTKFDISKIKESCNVQNQTILKTAETIKKVVEIKLKEHLTDVNELRRIYSEESQPNVAARIEKVAHKDFRKKLKKVEHQYQTIRQNFRYELHKVLFEKDWFNDLAIASIQSLMKEGEASEACVINDTINKFEAKNNELIESKEELMDMFEHGITTGQHELDTVIGILLITEAYRLKYDNDAIKKQTLFLDSIGVTSTTDDSTSTKKKKKKGKSANTTTTTNGTTDDHSSEDIKETSSSTSSTPVVTSPAISSTKSPSIKPKKAIPVKLEKQPDSNETNSKKNESTVLPETSTNSNTKLSSAKVEETVTNKGTVKKLANTSKSGNNNLALLPSSSPKSNNSDIKKNKATADVSAVRKVSEKATVKEMPEEPIHVVKIEDIPVSEQASYATSEKVKVSNNGWGEPQTLPTNVDNKQLESDIKEQATSKEIKFSRKKKENPSDGRNDSSSTDKTSTTRFSTKNKKSSNDQEINNNSNSSGWDQNQTSESVEKSPTTNPQVKKKNGWASDWGEAFKNNTDSGGWGSSSTNQSNNNDGWNSVSTKQTNKNESKQWGEVSNEKDTSNGWVSVGKNTSKKTITNSWSKPINRESKKDTSSGWDPANTTESTGWDKPKNTKFGGWDAPENNNEPSGWNTTKKDEPSGWSTTKNIDSMVSSGWDAVDNKNEPKKASSSGWDTPNKKESKSYSGWDAVDNKNESKITPPPSSSSSGWDTPNKKEAKLSSGWDSVTNNDEPKKTLSPPPSGWDAPNKKEPTSINSGWDTINNSNEPKKVSSPSSSSGWNMPNLNQPENTISDEWNTPKTKEPELPMFNHNKNSNNEMNYPGGWGSSTQSNSDTLSYNINISNKDNNINNNTINNNINNNNIPMNEPDVVNVSISDLMKSAEQDNYQHTQFPAPIEPNKTNITTTSPSIKPPPMIYPSFSTTLPMGNQSTNVDQLRGMSSDSLITMIHSLRFENDQLKQSMSTLQQTVNMTLTLAREREEQTIQLFNTRKQADLEEARIYILSLEAKINDLESQIRMQPVNPTRTGFDNQDIFAGYREEMRVGSGRNTNINDRNRPYNQRPGTGASSGGFGGGGGSSHPGGRKLWQRATIVKCSNCGESGHASSDCKDSCRYCNSREHLSEQCPQHY